MPGASWLLRSKDTPGPATTNHRFAVGAMSAKAALFVEHRPHSRAAAATMTAKAPSRADRQPTEEPRGGLRPIAARGGGPG